MLKEIFSYILLFFLYSFIGWLGESIYCSIPAKKWINRGFLTGPITPIYGTGALVMLIFLKPFKYNPLLVFFIGIILCDIVEYITSYMMEKLFHSRWWDYSNKVLNINGRICLQHSIIWGAASLFFIYFVHPAIGQEVLNILPDTFLYILVPIFLIIFIIDKFHATRKAINLGEKIKKAHTIYDSAKLKLHAISSSAKLSKLELANKKEKYTAQLTESYNILEELLKKRKQEKIANKTIEKNKKELARQKSHSKLISKYPNLEDIVKSSMTKINNIFKESNNDTTT